MRSLRTPKLHLPSGLAQISRSMSQPWKRGVRQWRPPPQARSQFGHDLRRCLWLPGVPSPPAFETAAASSGTPTSVPTQWAVRSRAARKPELASFSYDSYEVGIASAARLFHP